MGVLVTVAVVVVAMEVFVVLAMKLAAMVVPLLPVIVVTALTAEKTNIPLSTFVYTAR